jgi:hypothetical protein
MTARTNRLASALGWSEETLAVAVAARKLDREAHDPEQRIRDLRAIVLEPHLALAAENYGREGQRLEDAILAASRQRRLAATRQR